MFFGELSSDCFQIEIIDDGDVEDDETFQVFAMPQVPVWTSLFMEITITIVDRDIPGWGDHQCS